jgi:hypothetical protein
VTSEVWLGVASRNTKKEKKGGFKGPPPGIKTKRERLMNRCTAYKSLFKPGMQHQERALLNLQVVLTRLYNSILRLFAMAHRLHSRNTTKRTFHEICSPGDLSNLLVRCDEPTVARIIMFINVDFFSYTDSSFSRQNLEPVSSVSSASFAICAFGFYDVLSDWREAP